MKKLISLFLAVVFVFSLGCPFETVYAEEVSLEDTPIDVVYCYADLWDQNLRRGELDNSIKKDYDNQELKYSLRSVLKNIPWVRKIFIIMPNEKVRFLKEPEEISDKIVYVKNEDLLGFDTNSPHAKQITMWNLKKFGCSNHVIYLDDDFFIGKPLKKEDFFYVENNKVVPYVVATAKPTLKKLRNVEKSLANIKDKNNGGHPESNSGWYNQILRTYLFLMKNALNEDCINLVEFSHFAYSLNLDELEEVYDIIKNSEFADSTLYTKRRSNDSLMPVTVYQNYVLNKYSRKVRYPRSRCIIGWLDIDKANFDVELFVINSGARSHVAYRDSDYRKVRNTMKKLFPDATPYEIPDCKLDIFDFEEGDGVVRNSMLDNIRRQNRRRTGALR